MGQRAWTELELGRIGRGSKWMPSPVCPPRRLKETTLCTLSACGLANFDSGATEASTGNTTGTCDDHRLRHNGWLLCEGGGRDPFLNQIFKCC